MATVNGKVNIEIEATQAAPTGYTGGDVATVSIALRLSSGTGLNQADLLYSGTTSVTGSGSVDIDLRALTSPAGAALTGLTEIACIVVQWPSTAAGALTITPSASNGLVSLGASMIAQPGATIINLCPSALAYSVGASTKSLNFANAGATALATVTIFGRSA